MGKTSQQLKGRVAFVSGGLRGIGAAIAMRFVADGADVTIADLAPPEAPEVCDILGRLGSSARYIRLDVASEEQWQRSADEMEVKFGKLHILVNNAGVELMGAIQKTTLAAWRRAMSINADGVFLGTREMLPLLIESGADVRGGASIINLSSVMGLVGSPGASGYCATKGAVRMFTKAVALECAARGQPVRANSIHPGFISTPMLNSGFPGARGEASEKEAKRFAGLIDNIPMGRVGNPEEIAAVASFLAGSDSSYVTGAEIPVDGGWTAQ